MSNTPWLTIIGLGEDGLNGLSPASHSALNEAEIIIAPPRHLALLGDQIKAKRIEWPVPFADGLAQLAALRGQSVAVLASGDPFWFGAGSVIARDFDARGITADEWRAFPAPSTPALICARMGWALDRTTTLGLHAAPFDRLLPHLQRGAQIICTLRDGDAPRALADYLTQTGWGQSRMDVWSAVGGPNEHHLTTTAAEFDTATQRDAISHPVCATITPAGPTRALPYTTGRDEDWFDNDGQITKSPIRAMTLAALAPTAGEHLWDLGVGSGSVGIEWLLSHPSLTASGIERNADRAARAQANAAKFGVGHFDIRVGNSVDLIDTLPRPDAVFIGGGLNAALLDKLWSTLPSGTRLVVNAVTLETESLVTQAHATRGGNLIRIDVATAQPLGTMRGWKASYPVTQWSITR